MRPMRPMRVLVGCERSGVVRAAFRALGHDAWSCDLAPADDESPFHIQADVLTVLDQGWDLGIFHPTCTYLTNSAVWALTRTPPNPRPGMIYGEARKAAMQEAAQFFRQLLFTSAIPKVAVENPVMHSYALAIIGQRHTQTIQPYEFGNDASKRTCLWLRNLPKLVPTQFVPPRTVNGRKLWANQTDTGQNKLGPRFDPITGENLRAVDRSRTYSGIAAAFASQWGKAC